MIDYQDYHKSPIFLPNDGGKNFDGLSFETTRNAFHPFHFHDGVELMYVHKGAILVHAYDAIENVKEGQFIAHDPYTVHSVESIMPDTIVTCIDIAEKYISEDDGVISSAVQSVTEEKEYIRLSNDILDWIIMSEKPGTTQDKMLWQMKKIFPSMQRFLSVTTLYAKGEQTVDKDLEKAQERLTSIINYLFWHHDEALSLDTISAELYISKYYLSHYIKKAFGYTLKQTLSYIRCEESMIDLLGSQMTIAEVAAKHGFPSTRAYNEAFPRYNGVSPAEHRRRHEKNTLLYRDFAGEKISLDFLDRGDDGAAHLNTGYNVTINLPKGDYEILSVETGDDNVNNRLAKLNAKNKNIYLDSDCEELIVRIKRQKK